MKPLCELPFKSVVMNVWEDEKCLQFNPCHHMVKNEDDDHCPIHKMPNPLEWDNDSHTLTPNQIISHPIYKKLQDDMKNGVRNKACQVCWDMDDKTKIHEDGHNSIKSHRLNLKPIEKDTMGLIIQTYCGNMCNMACRMCTPIASNRFKKDIEILNIEDLKYVTDNFFDTKKSSTPISSIQWNWIKNNSEKIGALCLMGGEPLFDKKVIDLLSDISKNINLGLTTNGSMFTQTNCDLLNKFKGLYITLSIDSVYENYNYIRYPFKFEKLELSLSRFLSLCKNIKNLEINVVVSSLNLLNMKNFLSWSERFHIDTHFSEVFPVKRGIGIRNLPISILEKAYFDICNMNGRNVYKLTDLLDKTILKSKENKQKMLKEIELFDFSRNQNYKNFLNPLLVRWLNE